jgi:hypothetical protein
MTLETASGTLVPAARKVIPMTLSGILRVSPETDRENQCTKIKGDF